MSTQEERDQVAEEWLKDHVDAKAMVTMPGLLVARLVPCTIRCWRSGYDIAPGPARCPECGKEMPK